jgi:mevalonate kinase
MRRITASAPGSIMITGEHAVVYGHRAVVAAVEQRVTVTLTERADRMVRIVSQISDPLEAPLDALPKSRDYRFVLACIKAHHARIPAGFDLIITSQIDPTLGLGSSAAVTIAVLGALGAFSGADRTDLHPTAVSIVQDIQGRGSGADLAASLTGGMISYRAPPDAQINRLPSPPVLALRYAGYKTPTAEVLALIAKRMQGNTQTYKDLYAEMGAEAERAIAAAKAGDWPGFATSLTEYQTLMEQLGVCDQTLAQIIADARRDGGLLAAKISGSGLGDCVVALGSVPEGFTKAELATEGLIIHE